jgi:phosphonate transport system permease protein
MTLAELHAQRPRNRFATRSLALLALLMLGAWLSADYGLADMLSERRWRNVQRFIAEIRPSEKAWHTLLQEGLPAARDTLLLSIAGISVAAALALLMLPLVSAQLARPRPFEPGQNLLWRGLHTMSRWALICCRAVPEYVLAFLLVGILGVNAWPLVLALAVHNLGVLGRLSSEVLDNQPPALPRAMASLGHSRWQIYLTSLLPSVLPRFLVYFFYRWETCVRDSTVLGTLGHATLGYSIRDARSRQALDAMVLLMLLAAALVIAGDLFSSWMRSRLRE